MRACVEAGRAVMQWQARSECQRRVCRRAAGRARQGKAEQGRAVGDVPRAVPGSLAGSTKAASGIATTLNQTGTTGFVSKGVCEGAAGGLRSDMRAPGHNTGTAAAPV